MTSKPQIKQRTPDAPTEKAANSLPIGASFNLPDDTQISDMVKQLYEWFVLEAGGIRKKQKNISSDLLKSFGEQKTEREDIRRNDTQSVPAD